MDDIKERIAALGLPPEYAEAAESLFNQYSFDMQRMEERERELDARRWSELRAAVVGPELKANRASRRQKFGKKRK